MHRVPFVRVFAADTRKIGPRALRPPLKRMVIHALGGEAVMAVALDLVAKRADHLTMADVAAFADIDVASSKLERRIRPHALHLLDGRAQPIKRSNLDDAADGNGDQDAYEEEDGAPFQYLM